MLYETYTQESIFWKYQSHMDKWLLPSIVQYTITRETSGIIIPQGLLSCAKIIDPTEF